MIYLAIGNLSKLKPVSVEQLWQEFYYKELRRQAKFPSNIDVVM